jgi:O-acetyl-ADP-ribose deacetylase (regulator of RNase III)
MTNWRVVHGDILDHLADGLICSANPSLNLSGGVGGAFSLRYGDEMQHYLHQFLADNQRRTMGLGTAVIAPACGSPYVAVAHAVSVDAFYDTDAESILAAYNAAILGLSQVGCRSIVSACLGCGYGRVSESAFANLARKLVQMKYPTVVDIALISTNDILAAILQRVVEQPPYG